MPNTLKFFATLLILSLIQSGCADNCDLAKANVFQEVDQSDISNLEGINHLILKNVDTLKRANENNESDSIIGQNDKFHSIHSGAFEVFLSKEDYIRYCKLSLTFNSVKGKFYLYRVDFRPSDSTFNYELRSDICDNNEQAIDITHHLLWRTNIENYTYKNDDIAKEKKIDNHWTYYLENTPNDPH